MYIMLNEYSYFWHFRNYFLIILFTVLLLTVTFRMQDLYESISTLYCYNYPSIRCYVFESTQYF